MKSQDNSGDNKQVIENVKKLKHKIGNKVIIFTLQGQTFLRICVYDQSRVSQIYQGMYYGDCLPSQARNMFRTIGQMFQFLQMNFQALVTLNNMDGVIVDLNKLKIPIKFQLPFKLQVYPVVQDLLDSTNKKNKQLSQQIEQISKASQQKQKQLKLQLQQITKKIQQKEKQYQNKQQIYIQKIVQKERYYQEHIQKLQKQVQNKQNEIKQLKSQNQSLKITTTFLQSDLNQCQKNIFQLKQQNQELKQQKKNKNRNNNKSQQKAVVQKLKLNFSQQKIKQKNYQSPPPKQSNPFLTGLFSKNICVIKSQNSSQQKLPQQNISQQKIAQSQHNFFSKQKKTPQSRFHTFLDFQKNEQVSLNLSKRFIKDTDIQQLIKYNWSMVCRLNLSENIITGRGLQKLFNIKWPSLKSISLSANKICDFDLKALNFIAKTPNLMILDLNFNQIHGQTYKQIMQFARNSKIPKIYVNGSRQIGSSIMASPRMSFHR